MVLRKSSFYYSKTMVFEDSRFQKSKEIFEKWGQKISPKKVCRIEAKVSQNGAKMGATNRQHFEKYQKKGIQKTMRKKGAERNHDKGDNKSNAVRPNRDFGAGGGGI